MCTVTEHKFHNNVPVEQESEEKKVGNTKLKHAQSLSIFNPNFFQDIFQFILLCYFDMFYVLYTC